jgi:hypothetical protein
MYILSTIYNYGNGNSLDLMKSMDGGASWSTSTPLYGNEGGMCVYTANGQDVILLTDGYSVLKSPDGGASWNALSNLPSNFPWPGLRFLSIGTNSSWLGGPVDDMIYVVGAAPTYAGSAIEFTKSTDGGSTWSNPVQLPLTSYGSSGFQRITSDGANLYIVNEIGVNTNGIASLATSSSSDWGATWSDEKVIVQNDGGSYMLRPYGFQTLDNERALLTYVDEPTSYVASEITGNYGYYWFSNKTYQQVGSVSGPEWMVHEGFSGRLVGDIFSVAWPMALEEGTVPNSQVMFAQSKDTGLMANLTPPPAHSVRIDRGVAPIIWTMTAESNGVWTAEIENHGLKSLAITVYDITEKPNVRVLTQKFSFASADAVVTSNDAQMKLGHIYKITAKDGDGPRGSYALIMDELNAQASSATTPPMPSSANALLLSAVGILSGFVVIALLFRFKIPKK